MSKDDLLEQRKELKNKKPDFSRHDSHKNKKLGSSWRRPKGLQNKLRLNKRGYGKPVSTGYGSPKAVRGLHPSGYEPIRVHNTDDVDDVDPETQGIIIASNVGDRKRATIIEHAQDNDIEILNLDGDAKLQRIEEAMEERKEHREEIKKKKEERRKEAEEAREKEAEDPEEKEKELQQEMEDVVTKK
jgi:large subunit ribosomal protein L32e